MGGQKMGADSFIRFLIALFVAVILSLFIALSGCTNLPPRGKTAKTTGEEVRPPQGYIDWKKRIESID